MYSEMTLSVQNTANNLTKPSKSLKLVMTTQVRCTNKMLKLIACAVINQCRVLRLRREMTDVGTDIDICAPVSFAVRKQRACVSS
jgi:hypothetical protein